MASSAPAEIPLMSEGKLRTYALSQVREVEGSVYSPSMAGNDYFSVPYTNTDSDPVKMASLVKSQKMTFTVDPTDTIQNDVVYYSTNYPYSGGYTVSFSLFYGSTNFQLQFTNGGYVIPTSAYNVPLIKSDWIPFPIKGVSYAYIYTKDKNGNINGYYDFGSNGRLDAANGFLFLGDALTGLSGDLYVGFNDGSRVIYNLGTDQLVPLVSETMPGLSVSLDGIRTLPDNTMNVVYQAGDQVIRVAYTTNCVVSVTFPSGLAEYPTMVHGDDSQDLWANPGTDGNVWNPVVSQPLFKGVIGKTLMIWFDYPDDNQLPNNNGGGSVGVGKGAVEATATTN